MSRWPRPFLTERIAEFYRDNPDEELTYPQMRAKFGCTIEQLAAALSALKSRDILHTASLCVVRAGANRDGPPQGRKSIRREKP